MERVSHLCHARATLETHLYGACDVASTCAPGGRPAGVAAPPVSAGDAARGRLSLHPNDPPRRPPRPPPHPAPPPRLGRLGGEISFRSDTPPPPLCCLLTLTVSKCQPSQ
eukprot:811142-Prorocentrum_minimum.AAC.2